MLVSIVLPTFNGARYLAEAIDSCLSQTYQDIELIVVDDASTDETASVLQAIEDPRVSCFKNPVNLGLPRSLNVGFANSRGQYLTWTSDDNLYQPTAVETMVAYLEEHPEVAFVYADYAVIDEEGSLVNTLQLPPPESLQECCCIGACFLYRRAVYEMVGEYDPAMTLAEDYDYWLRVYRQFRMARISELLYKYRKHKRSLTTQEGLDRQQRAVEKVRTKWLGPDPHLYPSRFARALSQKYIELAFNAHRAGLSAEVRRYAVKALTLDPRWIRNRGLLSIVFRSLTGQWTANEPPDTTQMAGSPDRAHK